MHSLKKLLTDSWIFIIKKTKIWRGSQKPRFDCSQLKNRSNTTKHPSDISKYLKTQSSSDEQQFFFSVLSSLPTSKNLKPFFSDWCRPCFSNKYAYGDFKIVLIETEKLLVKSPFEPWNHGGEI